MDSKVLDSLFYSIKWSYTNLELIYNVSVSRSAPHLVIWILNYIHFSPTIGTVYFQFSNKILNKAPNWRFIDTYRFLAASSDALMPVECMKSVLSNDKVSIQCPRLLWYPLGERTQPRISNRMRYDRPDNLPLVYNSNTYTQLSKTDKSYLHMKSSSFMLRLKTKIYFAFFLKFRDRQQLFQSFKYSGDCCTNYEFMSCVFVSMGGHYDWPNIHLFHSQTHQNYFTSSVI